MRNTSSLLILILATTIANVLEMSISPETGEANGGQMMNNASESYSAETVKDLSIIITYDNNGYQEGLKVKYVVAPAIAPEIWQGKCLNKRIVTITSMWASEG